KLGTFAMPARPRPAALEAEAPTESGTARLSRQALNTRRTEIRTVAHWRLESRRAESSERQRDRTAKAVQFPRREMPLWNFFRQEFDERSYSACRRRNSLSRSDAGRNDAPSVHVLRPRRASGVLE